ncbi:hypothetical protein F5Y19DRAFT_491647 [Xylariaceae sp. FL1651]|nr:hypothetical protein F5Y19DRAFT_491647 [Xylariaceae sp. FL1651]
MACYFRIFPTTTIRRCCYILAAASTGWLITAIVASQATCSSADSSGSQHARSKCVFTPTFTISLSATNAIIDLATMTLPIYEVSKLQMSGRTKYRIVSIFTLSGFATAASLAPFITILLHDHQTAATTFGRTSVLLGILSPVEIDITLIGICAVTLGPVFEKLCGRSSFATSSVQSKTRSQSETGNTSKIFKKQSETYVRSLSQPTSKSRLRGEEDDDDETPLAGLEDALVLVPLKARSGCQTDISFCSAAGLSQIEDIPFGHIRVQRDITWT